MSQDNTFLLPLSELDALVSKHGTTHEVARRQRKSSKEELDQALAAVSQELHEAHRAREEAIEAADHTSRLEEQINAQVKALWEHFEARAYNIVDRIREQRYRDIDNDELSSFIESYARALSANLLLKARRYYRAERDPHRALTARVNPGHTSQLNDEWSYLGRTAIALELLRQRLGRKTTRDVLEEVCESVGIALPDDMPYGTVRVRIRHLEIPEATTRRTKSGLRCRETTDTHRVDQYITVLLPGRLYE